MIDTAALAVEQWPIDRPKPNPNNSRLHPEEQLAAINRSMDEFGFYAPLLVRAEDDDIIAGHGRLEVARRRGMKTIPVIPLAGLTDAQVRALRIADNQLPLGARWNEDALRLELTALKALEFDLAPLGFEPQELKDLMAAPPANFAGDPDATPELPTKVRSRLGDVWLLGPHRLMCGDSTKAEDVNRLLGQARPHLMVTDPPYGVEYDANWRNEADRANGKPYGARAVGKVQNDARADWREAWALFPGQVAYVWHAGRHASAVQASLEAAKFEIRCQIIWAKNNFAISRGHYHWQHEPCWYAVRQGPKGAQWTGGRSQTTLWAIDKPQKSETGHSTQKPVECMRRPILNNSKPGDAVYEPFSGSGTTLIAGQMEGRTVLAMEISPAYVDVAVARWQAFTGQKATRESDGAAFDDVLALEPEPGPKG